MLGLRVDFKMLRFVRAASAALALVVTSSACSSIPDVSFDDGDGGDSGTASSDGGTDARADGDYSCPENPPPSGVGICCPLGGTPRLCLNCQATEDCARCFVEGCTGTMSSGKVCCKKNGSRVTCDEAADCR